MGVFEGDVGRLSTRLQNLPPTLTFQRLIRYLSNRDQWYLLSKTFRDLGVNFRVALTAVTEQYELPLWIPLHKIGNDRILATSSEQLPFAKYLISQAEPAQVHASFRELMLNKKVVKRFENLPWTT